MANRNRITTVGRRQGSVMYNMRWKPFAPSTFAASIMPVSIDVMAAKYTTVP